MNKARRKRIADLIDQLAELKEELTGVIEEEQESIDNYPDNLVGSERYNAEEEALSYLDDAGTLLDEIIDTLSQTTDE